MRISDWSSDVCSSDLGAILRRDNEAELVAVAIGPLQESLAVDLISIRTIEHAALALAGRAVTLQITKVSGRRARSFLAKHHDPRLDDDATRPGPGQPHRRREQPAHTRAAPNPFAGNAHALDGQPHQPPSPSAGTEHTERHRVG